MIVKPILKWAGGKTSMLETLLPLVRERLAEGGVYVEPFLGAGAVALAMPEETPIVGSDSLIELMTTWLEIRRSPRSVSDDLEKHRDRHGRDHYLDVRASAPEKPSAIAARLIYLNKTGFNGLYRVNKSGQFNVPIGRGRATSIPTLTELLVVQRRISSWSLMREDFETVVDETSTCDCVFADPPYAGTHDYSSGFDDADRRRLSACLERAARRDVGVVVTDAWSARETYRWMRVRASAERRRVSCNVDGRADAECLVGVWP